MARIWQILVAAGLALLATEAAAEFHLWRIEQVFSNADGTIQFVVMRESKGASGEHKWGGHLFFSTVAGTEKSYTFIDNLPSSATANKRALIATEGFAALGLVKPDYVIPNGFLGIGEGRLNFADVDLVTYDTLPKDGVSALTRDGDVVPNVATNFAGKSASVPAGAVPPPPSPPPSPPPASTANYQGLWWNAPAGSESGWGINFAHQGDTIFATWFTFDVDGSPLWMVAAAPKTADKVYSGSVLRGTGPAYNAVPFNPALVVGTTVGTATFTFTDESNGTFAYVIGPTNQTKNITRQVFSSPVPTCTWNPATPLAAATNFQDLWWASPAGSESGWGINFTHQGDTIFGTWFTFDTNGKPLWMVVSAGKTAANTYSGRLYRGTGPAFNAVPFDPKLIVPAELGTATFTFTDGNNGTFAATVDGATLPTKAITRELFSDHGTACQ